MAAPCPLVLLENICELVFAAGALPVFPQAGEEESLVCHLQVEFGHAYGSQEASAAWKGAWSPSAYDLLQTAWGQLEKALGWTWLVPLAPTGAGQEGGEAALR